MIAEMQHPLFRGRDKLERLAILQMLAKGTGSIYSQPHPSNAGTKSRDEPFLYSSPIASHSRQRAFIANSILFTFLRIEAADSLGQST